MLEVIPQVPRHDLPERREQLGCARWDLEQLQVQATSSDTVNMGGEIPF